MANKMNRDDSVPPIKYAFHSNDTSWTFSFDSKHAPEDGEYKAYTVSIQLKHSSHFDASEHSPQGFFSRLSD